MALLQANRIKTVLGNNTLSLSASANESFVVRDIHVSGMPGGYATVYLGDSTRGYFRTDSSTLGNHTSFIPHNVGIKTILGELADRGIFTGYPVGTGTTFTIKNSANANISVVYDRYDKDDIKDTMPNGAESKEYTYLVYGRPEANISTPGTFLINQTTNPAELPSFPFQAAAPSGESIVHGVIFSARAMGTTINNIHTKYLKIMKGEKNLFDEDKNGYIALGFGSSSDVFAAENGYDISGEITNLYLKQPLFFTKPLVFLQDESFDTYWTTELSGTGGTLTQAQLEISYIVTKKGK